MGWLGVIDAGYWAADFRVARLVHHVYVSCGRPWPAVVVGLAQEAVPHGGLGPAVAGELRKGYSAVYGHPQQPVTVDELPALLQEVRQEFPNSFLLLVQGALLPPAVRGTSPQGLVLGWSARVQEPQDEAQEGPLPEAGLLMAASQQAAGGERGGAAQAVPAAAECGHLHLIGMVASSSQPARADRSFSRTCDVLVDGILRFFYRVGLLG